MHPTPERARQSANVIFMIYGTLVGAYLPYLPFVKDRFGIGESTFSLGFLAGAVGALISLPLAPLVIAWIGTRKAVALLSLAYLALVAIMMGAPNFSLYLVVFFLVGLTFSTWEIGINSQASVLEDMLEKPIMSSIHGFWSLGTFAGSLGMTGWLALKLDGLWLLYTLIAISYALIPYVYAGLLRREQIPAESATDRPPFKLRYLFFMPLLALSLYQIIGFMIEGSLQDWGALFIRELVLGHGAAIVPESQWHTLPADEVVERRRAAVVGGLVLAFFTLFMTIGRMVGDPLVARFGRVGTLQIGGIVAAGGVALLTLLPLGWTTYLGFALAGLGTANIIPQVVKTADGTPGLPPGVALSILTAIGFVAFMGGPVLIGTSGEHFSFKWTFFALGVLPVIMTLTARPLFSWFARSKVDP